MARHRLIPRALRRWLTGSATCQNITGNIRHHALSANPLHTYAQTWAAFFASQKLKNTYSFNPCYGCLGAAMLRANLHTYAKNRCSEYVCSRLFHRSTVDTVGYRPILEPYCSKGDLQHPNKFGAGNLCKPSATKPGGTSEKRRRRGEFCKKSSVHGVNEHFFAKFNDARASEVVFQRLPSLAVFLKSLTLLYHLMIIKASHESVFSTLSSSRPWINQLSLPFLLV